MFEDKVQKRLSLLMAGNEQPVEVSDQQFHLTEKKSGYADLQVQLSNPGILFRDLENRKFQYFRNKKCADYVMFEKQKNNWILHIFEMKRSVGIDEWSHIKKQFAGALQNALGLAGVLGIEFDLRQTRIYTVYRNDKLNDAANPVSLRCQIHEKAHGNKKDKKEIMDWFQEQVALELFENISLKHQKIKLNIENGTGECKV